MKVLVVRAIEDARRTAARLAARGHEAILAPVLDIRPLPHEIPEGAFDALIATSAHAVTGALPEGLIDVAIFVVGERTAAAAARAGALSAWMAMSRSWISPSRCGCCGWCKAM